MSKLSIIMPVLDEGEGIVAALDALADLRARGTGVIVVDGGSRDATVQRARPRADRVMCRNLISVDWRGYIYDCDFNQMLDLPLKYGPHERVHLSDLLDVDIEGRPIRVAGHCYGCTAGQGSSCGGALAQATAPSA